MSPRSSLTAAACHHLTAPNALKVSSLIWGSASLESHQLMQRKPQWPEPAQSRQQKATPTHKQGVPLDQESPSHLPPPAARMESGFWVSLYLEKRLKETNALAKIPLPSAPWKCPVEGRRGRSLSLHTPGRMVQPPAAAALPCFTPVPWHRPRPAFHRPLPPCALSQRDELTSSITEFHRSQTHSFNFTKPCQRPWSKIQ